MQNVLPKDDWLVRLQTVGVLPGFPYVWTVAVETRTDQSYRLCGRTRRDKNHCLFQYTLAGEGVFQNAAGLWRVGVGQGFLCEICDPAVRYYYPEDARDPWRFLFFCFGGDAAFAMVRAMLARQTPVYSLSAGSPFIRRLLGMGAMARNIASALFPEAGCELSSKVLRSVVRRDLAQSDSLSLVMHLLAALVGGRAAESADDSVSLLARRAMDLVDQRLADNLNVSQLADLLKVSREHLTRVFHAHTGQSPHDYLLRQKMLAACLLVKDSGDSIKEIAGRMGFNSAAHFSRVFRREFEMTPRQFRASGHVPAL